MWVSHSLVQLEELLIYKYHLAGNICQEKFSPILPPAQYYWGDFYHAKKFLFYINDFIEDTATFTTLGKFIPVNISAMQKFLD